IRVVATTKQPAVLVKYFLRFPLIVQVEEQTKTSCVVRLADGSRVSLVAVRPAEFALTLLTETGSQAHLAKLQQVAQSNRKGKSTRGKLDSRSSGPKTEAELYRRW